MRSHLSFIPGYSGFVPVGMPIRQRLDDGDCRRIDVTALLPDIALQGGAGAAKTFPLP